MEYSSVPCWSPCLSIMGCVVDLLSHAGRLAKAEDMIKSMPMKPNVTVWI